MVENERKIITIEPCAGLGNRLGALASIYKIAQANHWKLNIVWKREEACYARFSKLFRLTDEDIKIAEVVEMPYRMQPFLTMLGNLKKVPYKSNAYFVASEETKALIQKENPNETVERYPEFIALLRGYDRIYIKSHFLLCTVDSKDYQFIKPSIAVEKRGMPLWTQIDDNTIGVHIRRTDHTAAIIKSPLSFFYSQMERELEENSDAKFYIASDDNEVLREMKKRYGNKCIIFDNREASRLKEKGIIDATVELFALSKCKKILGSYNSTFSTTAALLGNIKNEVVHS